VPKKTKPARRRAPYNSPPPALANGRVPDDLHAIPIVPAHFELREDGTIQINGHEPTVEQIKTPPPRLTFADSDRQIWLYHGNALELLDAIYTKYGDAGRFDAIFADPPAWP
jgi:hypothetical protein